MGASAPLVAPVSARRAVLLAPAAVSVRRSLAVSLRISPTVVPSTPSEHEPETGEHQHEHRHGGLPGAAAAPRQEPRPAREMEGPQVLLAGVQQDRHIGRRGGLAGRDEGELVGEVKGVLHGPDDAARPGALLPRAPGPQPEVCSDAFGHDDLACACRVAATDEAERDRAEGGVRALRPEVDGGH